MRRDQSCVDRQSAAIMLNQAEKNFSGKGISQVVQRTTGNQFGLFPLQFPGCPLWQTLNAVGCFRFLNFLWREIAEEKIKQIVYLVRFKLDRDLMAGKRYFAVMHEFSGP